MRVIRAGRLHIYIQPAIHPEKDLPERIGRYQRDDCTCQVVNLSATVSWRHIVTAALKTDEVFSTGENIAAKRHVEFLLRLTGRRQIKDAVRIAGVGRGPIVVVCFGGDPGECGEVFREVLKLCRPIEDDAVDALSEDRVRYIVENFGVTGRPDRLERDVLTFISLLSIRR